MNAASVARRSFSRAAVRVARMCPMAVAALCVSAAWPSAADGLRSDPDLSHPVIVRIVEHQRVPTRERADAEEQVSRFFAQVGVRIVWAASAGASDAAGHGIRLDLHVLSPAMTDADPPPPGCLAQATPVIRRAYVHYARLVAHALATRSDPARVLAFVLAHEIGHLLLPHRGHVPFGLMRAEAEGRIVNIPTLTAGQASAIRTRLLADGSTPAN